MLLYRVLTLSVPRRGNVQVRHRSLEFFFFFVSDGNMGLKRCLKERLISKTQGRTNMGKLELSGRREKA